MPDIDMTRVTTLKTLPKKSYESHQMSVVEFDNRQWFRKNIASEYDARMEVLAQEFFRLIIPHQPETRIGIDHNNNTFSVLSEEVAGFHGLPNNEAHNFRNGKYTGFGQASLLAMFVKEGDFKNGNVGLDDKNRVIKIDGDYGFYSFENLQECPITPENIGNLPYPPKDFHANNWLDLVKLGTKLPNSTLIDAELADSPQFRSEVNQAMQRIILIPDSYLQQFLGAYMPGNEWADKRQEFTDLILLRRDQLKNAALNNDSFKSYLQTEEADANAKQMLEQLKSFKAAGEPVVSSEEYSQLESNFNQQRNFADNTEFSECQAGLYQLRKLQAEFTRLNIEFITEKQLNELQQAVVDNKHNAVKLAEINANLVGMLERYSSYIPCANQLNAFATSRQMDLASPVFDPLKKMIAESQDLSATGVELKKILAVLVNADKEIDNKIYRNRSQSVDSKSPISESSRVDGIANIQKALFNSAPNLQVLNEKNGKLDAQLDAFFNCRATLQTISQLMTGKISQDLNDSITVNKAVKTMNENVSKMAVNLGEIPQNLAESEKLIKVCCSTIDKIQTCAIGGSLQKDTLMQTELKQFRKDMMDALANNNINELKKISEKLTFIEKAVKSDEVIAVKNSIQSLRKGRKFFHFGGTSESEKADKVEAALLNLPLAQRLNVISGPNNQVQEELARHRLYSQKDTVIKDTHGNIDINAAADAFKELKKKYVAVKQPDVEYEAEKTIKLNK